jgi:hypothetical protein
MSNTSQGPGWWLASDGKWYPPELWTGPPGQGPAPQPTSPAQPTYPAQSTSPPQPAYPTYPAQAPAAGAVYGAGNIPPGYAGYGAGNPYANYVQPDRRKTNGMAIAGFICGCAGLLFLPAILGIVFGFIARSQIRRSEGRQKGDGLAIAGILVAIGWLALLVLSIALGHTTHGSNSGVVNSAILMG